MARTGAVAETKCVANRKPRRVLPPSPKKVWAIGKFQHSTPKAMEAPAMPKETSPTRQRTTAEEMKIEMQRPLTPSMKL